MAAIPRALRAHRHGGIDNERPLTLTAAFAIGAVILLVFAAFVADAFGRRIGEAATVRLGTHLGESDAQVLGATLERALASGLGQEAVLTLETSGTSPRVSAEHLAAIADESVGPLTDSLEIHHMSVLTAGGQELWSVGVHDETDDDHEVAEAVITGQRSSWLSRGITTTGENGETRVIDVIESVVPLSGDFGGFEQLVFHMEVDATEMLRSNIAATQSDIRNTTLVLLGVLLGLLALLVLALDLGIYKRWRSVLAQERDLREGLGERNEELQRIDEAKNEFLSSMSHELKTPLAAMLGFARILKKNRDGNLSEKQVQQLQIVSRNGERLDKMISELLDVSRIQTGRIKLSPAPAEITGLLRSAVDSLLPILRDKNQQVKLNIAHRECWVNIDEARIMQVITNLITNASKYSPTDTTIRVESRIEADSWVVQVADQGEGIPRESQPGLFSMFYRTPEAAKSGIPGTGIGLFVSKEILVLHGGDIDLESAPGLGTTVTFRLYGVSKSSAKPEAPGESSSGFANSLDELEEVV